MPTTTPMSLSSVLPPVSVADEPASSVADESKRGSDNVSLPILPSVGADELSVPLGLEPASSVTDEPAVVLLFASSELKRGPGTVSLPILPSAGADELGSLLAVVLIAGVAPSVSVAAAVAVDNAVGVGFDVGAAADEKVAVDVGGLDVLDG